MTLVALHRAILVEVAPNFFDFCQEVARTEIIRVSAPVIGAAASAQYRRFFDQRDVMAEIRHEVRRGAAGGAAANDKNLSQENLQRGEM